MSPVAVPWTEAAGPERILCRTWCFWKKRKRKKDLRDFFCFFCGWIIIFLQISVIFGKNKDEITMLITNFYLLVKIQQRSDTGGHVLLVWCWSSGSWVFNVDFESSYAAEEECLVARVAKLWSGLSSMFAQRPLFRWGLLVDATQENKKRMDCFEITFLFILQKILFFWQNIAW